MLEKRQQNVFMWIMLPPISGFPLTDLDTR